LRRLKAVSGLFLVVLAAAAFAAGPAPAAQFNSEAQPTILTAESEGVHRFFATVLGYDINCKKVSFVGTMPVKSVTEIRLAPTYSECTESGIPMTVAMNGCEYLITATLKGSHRPMHIVCPVGAKIEITMLFSSCKTKIGAQTPAGGGLAAVNKGAGTTRDVTFTFTVSGISYERTGSCEALLASDMTYAGTMTLQGFTDKTGAEGPQVGIWLE
jgi:hypothetical protein